MRRSLFAASVVILVGCGGTTAPGSGNQTGPGGSGTGTSGSGPTITVANNTFLPDNVTTTVNTLVTWSWDACADGYGGMCTSHTVTFDDGQTSTVQSSGTFTRRFTAPGTYAYKCTIHSGTMTGKIIVQ